MGFFNKKRTDGATYDGQGEDRRGFIDVIQYNGDPDDLVWKFPYNNLSIGAQLIVNKSQEAIFVKVAPFVMSLVKAHTHFHQKIFRCLINSLTCLSEVVHLSWLRYGL